MFIAKPIRPGQHCCEMCAFVLCLHLNLFDLASIVVKCVYCVMSTAKPIRPGQHQGGQLVQNVGIRGGGGAVLANGPASVKEYA